MTHMDDQVAKHIKDMVRRIMREPSESQEQPAKPDTLNQVVQLLRQALFIRMNWCVSQVHVG
jgi:hypothetical protein